MFPTETIFKGSDYEIIAWANREKLLYYQKFGSYQGEWLIITLTQEDEYKFYKGSYGSCSGCDSYEAVFDYLSEITLEKAKDFSKDYEAFLIVPRDTMNRVLRDGVLRTLLPANRRDAWDDDMKFDEIVKDLVLLFKLEENLPFTTEEIIEAPNAESKQRALKIYGYEKFVSETSMQEIDVDGENKLLKNKDIVFVYVKDSSTPRRYLLRVPPRTKTVKEGIAWTFGMTEKEYKPILET